MSCLKQKDAKLGGVHLQGCAACGADELETSLFGPGGLRGGHAYELKYMFEWGNRYKGDLEINS